MKIPRRVLAFAVLATAGLTGCNSSSTPPATTAPPTGTDASAPGAKSPSAAPPDTTAADSAGAPQRKPAAGKGNAIGRVLFNGKGAAGIEVSLCENIQLIGGCAGKSFEAKTDKDGYYVVDNVQPGDYALAVRIFNSNKFIYPTSGILSAAKYKIEADKSLSVRTVNLWKTDMQVVSPPHGGTVKTGAPQLSWKAYPNAANYKVTLRAKESMGMSTTLETSATSIAPDKPLLNGAYQWKVEASNVDGTKLAETNVDAEFKVVGQAGSNTVDLVYPKTNATVPGAALTLQWKAHPQASEYRVYVKGAAAKDAVLSFQSVTATSYKFTAPLPADQYFWSVEAYKDGEKLAGSNLVNFHVK